MGGGGGGVVLLTVKRKRLEEIDDGCDKMKRMKKMEKHHFLFMERQENRVFLMQLLMKLTPWDLAYALPNARKGQERVLNDNNLFWYLAAQKYIEDVGTYQPLYNYRTRLLRYWRE